MILDGFGLSASQAELHFFAVSADFVHLCATNPGSQSLRSQKGTSASPGYATRRVLSLSHPKCQ